MTTLDILGCSSFRTRPKWPHVSRICQESTKWIWSEAQEDKKWQWKRIWQHKHWSILWWSWDQAWGLRSLHSSIKWCSREKEPDTNHPCKNNAWWVQYTRSSMGGSYQHRMLCIQSPISSKVSWQDSLWVAQWEEAKRFILPGVWLQMLHLQEVATPREVLKTLWYWFSCWLLIKVQSISSI